MHRVIPKAIAFGPAHYRMGLCLAMIRWNLNQVERLKSPDTKDAALRAAATNAFAAILTDIEKVGSLENLLLHKVLENLSRVHE